MCLRSSRPSWKSWESVGTRAHKPASQPYGWGRLFPNWTMTMTSPLKNSSKMSRMSSLMKTVKKMGNARRDFEPVLCEVQTISTFELTQSLLYFKIMGFWVVASSSHPKLYLVPQTMRPNKTKLSSVVYFCYVHLMKVFRFFCSRIITWENHRMFCDEKPLSLLSKSLLPCIKEGLS